MIDGHCHLSLHQGALPGVKFASSAEYSTLWAARALNKTLRAGITGISVPGGKWFVDVTVRDAVNAGLIEGPRMFTAGRGLTPYGGIFDTDPSWTNEPDSSGFDDSAGVICNTVDDYRTEVRRQCKHGVDLIKVADSFWGDIQTISQEELTAVVDEAHRRKVKVAIHSRGSGSTRASALAGVDWIFHADFATDEDLEAVAEAGMPIMPVFTAVHVAVEYGAEIGFSPEVRDRMRAQLESNYRSAQKARQLGIPLLSGSDSGNAAAFVHGKYSGWEPEIMVKYVGLSPLEAITAATKLNAQVVGLEGEVGVIEEGKLADISIWDKDPVADIGIFKDDKNLKVVLCRGKNIDLENEEGFLKLPYEPPRAVRR
jgi:imidazolonepropionase-like amidohydrolase